MTTPRMKSVLNIIELGIEATGVCPSYEEIAKRSGLKSKSGVSRILDALEDRGLIRRLKYRSRAITIVRSSCPHCGKAIDGGTT